MNAQEKKSFYDFTVTDNDGQPFHLSSLKGKKVMSKIWVKGDDIVPIYEKV